MATDDQTPDEDEMDAVERETFVRRIFERDYERHRDIYEALETE